MIWPFKLSDIIILRCFVGVNDWAKMMVLLYTVIEVDGGLAPYGSA